MAKTDAQTALKVMCELEEHGRLTAAGLVEASRPEDAPMHQDFEWDDAIAGEQWRKAQARTYIAGIVYAPVQTQGEPVRVFAKVTTGSSEYTNLETIIRSPDSLEILRQNAVKELQSYQTKYSTILKLANALEPLSNVIEQLSIEVKGDKHDECDQRSSV